jgi:hypothetical protein
VEQRNRTEPHTTDKARRSPGRGWPVKTCVALVKFLLPAPRGLTVGKHVEKIKSMTSSFPAIPEVVFSRKEKKTDDDDEDEKKLPPTCMWHVAWQPGGVFKLLTGLNTWRFCTCFYYVFASIAD